MIGLYPFTIILVSSLLFLYLFGVIKVSLFKLRLCALTLCHAFRHDKFMAGQKSEKGIEGKGLSNSKLKGVIIGRLLDWTKTLEMKENNRVVIVINPTIDVLARLVEH